MPSISPPPKRNTAQGTRDTNAKGEINFHPSQITPSTFAKLLQCYPQTVKNVRRNKAIAKIKSKTEKGKGNKRKAEPGQNIGNEELSASDEKLVTDEVNQYLDLDRWRYETLPELVRKRRDEGGDVGVLGKEDVEGIMEWKL